MKRQKLSSLPKRNQTKKRRSKTLRKSKTTWADPTVPITKISKRKKIKKLDLNEMKNNSFWWFG